jgi:hypothetical protein
MTAAKNSTRAPDPIPNFASSAEERAFWDTHDFTDYVGEWERVHSPPATSVAHIVSFELDIDTLSSLIELGKQRGVEPLTLAAQWLAERVAAERER